MKQGLGYGIAIIGLTALALAMAAVASPVAACDSALARPSIQVTTHVQPVEFDLDQSVDDLKKFDISTPSPYPAEYHADVGGVMSGHLSVNHRMNFRTSVDEATGQGCVSLTSITVNIEVDPKVFVASDFRNKECLFKEIFGHEAKHVEVDRAVIEKYRARFADGLDLILKIPADYQSRELPQQALEGEQERMQEEIEYALGVMFSDMMAERAMLQQDIDSQGEYSRIAHSCETSS